MAERAQRKIPDSSRRSERSRRAIHEAALALIGEVGYAKTTIEGIAARAGVGKQTIYRWWPSKAAVLLEAFLDLTGEAAGAGEVGGEGESESEAYAIPDTGDLEADLKLVLRATVDQMNDPRFDVPSRALAAEGIVNLELGTEFVRKLLEPQLQLYVRRLTAAQATEAGGVRRGVDPRIALELLVGPVTHRWMLRTAPLTHEYTDAVVEYALYGLAPRP
ncbi:TetR/AcrR family transcriptional regulator [Streptomyces corynorhini]|uniref:TetR/AcrR family transcriptional regulator n=1 Tax=Streptomyces corynorhini TaxID=2282652 RepID=A0A370BI48_9ACTN|nr:TetR/AcrR family transcriptional regulator [Streptomyces corynorhini]RDG39336.1 TetR/AcrR family transcriptional regulator [Streptomyces corynorhini]